MVSFAQWWSTFHKSKKVSPHYYLLGSEIILIEEVISLIQDNFEVSEWNVHKFTAGLSSERDIWESLYATSMDGGNSLTIVRGVDRLRNRDLIPDLIEVKQNKHVVIFVSDERKIEKELQETDDGKSYVLPSYLRNFEKKGKIIECNPFSQSSAKTAVAWIKTKVESKDGALIHLLNSSNGDMRVVRDVIQKLKWMRESATLRNVSAMLTGIPSEEFVDALVSMNKEAALKALNSVSDKEYLQIIGKLDAQVDLVGRVHDLLAQRKGIPEIMRSMGKQAFLVPSISKVATQYSKDRVLQMRILLEETDRRIRQGMKEGVMESLVVLW